MRKVEMSPNRVVRLHLVEGDRYKISDTHGNLVVPETENFRIHLRDVIFNKKGHIDAVYEGRVMKGVQPGHTVKFDEEEGWVSDGEQITFNRFATVENGINIIVH